MIEITLNYGNAEFKVLATLLTSGTVFLPPNKRRKWKSRDDRRRIADITLCILGMLECIVSLYCKYLHFPVWVFRGCLIIGIVAILLSMNIGKKIFNFKERREIIRDAKAQNEASGSRRVIQFTETEIVAAAPNRINRCTWNDVRTYGEYRHYLWIRPADLSLILIDKNKVGAEDYEAIKNLCEKIVIRSEA